ncbi:MAG TPA: Rieske (2Fe-2S) protein [Sporichthyaceae bacterium]
MPEHDDPTLPAHPARRTVLRGALALGAVGALAGCGGSSSDSGAVRAPSGGDTGGSTPTAAAPTEGSPSPSASASDSGSSSSGGEALGASSDIPVGGGQIYDAQKVVVTQPTAGSYQGFSAICTHEGCTVSDVSDGTINCPCHGSKYSINDGSVVHGPAQQPLPSKNVSVSGGNVSLTA